MLDSLVSGVVFGAALTATGMYEPAVIVSQMKLENWHMVQTFLTASSASTLIVALFQKLDYLHVKPRNYSSLGLLGPLDGNLLGGALLGVGMTLSGSCPGSVFAQVGAGVPAGFYTLAGCVLGGLVWSGILRPTLASLKSKHRPSQQQQQPLPLTIHDAVGTSRAVVLLGTEVVFVTAIATISTLGLVKTRGLVGPVSGGLLVASAQLFSALIRKTLLGTSASFEELGDYLAWRIRGGQGPKPTSYSSIAVVSGMVLGGFGLSLIYSLPEMRPGVHIGTSRLILGGVLMAVGSRMGGGCTSGHGITGISLLSISSFVSVTAMFAGAFSAGAFI
ncbi:hypothetical protein F4777DRAFT_513577 [Nemania sp. FL0916]|nr:hypothetical protein F4777DRAFT_513577 [Nemania sp. FL0916]